MGVFVNQPLDDMRRAVEQAGIQVIQLHGDEAPDAVGNLACRVIKAVGVDRWFSPEAVTVLPPQVLPLLDVKDPRRRGGTGRSVDWMRAAQTARLRPVLLAGGLRPETVADAIRVVAPFGVDVSSGVERGPGVKDHQRMRAFVSAVRQADGVERT